MKTLTVLYDFHCALCQRARRWLEAQPKFVALEFIPAGSDHARHRFPTLPNTVEELVVVADDGGVYKGDRGWIMCLYALEEYREWALRLATPRLLPLARAAFELISENRIALSRLFRLYNEEGVAEQLARYRVTGCAVPPPAPPRPAGAPGSGGQLTVCAANGMREWLE
jgi:predicted DCC family thiol-disulfide oxidoreductase YuxK